MSMYKYPYLSFKITTEYSFTTNLPQDILYAENIFWTQKQESYQENLKCE